MIFEEALEDELKKINELEERIYALNAEEGDELPYIIYVSSEGLEDKSLLGYLASREVECEINTVHNTYSEMKVLTKQVLGIIKSFQSRSIGKEGPFIQNVTFQKPVELYEPEISAYRSVIECKFRF